MQTPKIYYEEDANLALIQNKKIAVIGYGSQGHAHALNLKDSGMDVVVGLREDSTSKTKAEAEGLKVVSVAEASQWADIVMMLTPDQHQKKIYTEEIIKYFQLKKPIYAKTAAYGHFGRKEFSWEKTDLAVKLRKEFKS